MVLSVQNVKHYKYSENAQMDAISSGPYQTIRKISTKDENGAIDSKGRDAKQISTSVISDFSGQTLSRDEHQAYLIGDKLYTKADGQWSMSNVSDPAKAFGECDKLKCIAGLIRSSDIEAISTEAVDGQKCYKLRIRPEPNNAYDLIKDQALEAYSSTAAPLPEISSKDLSDRNTLLDNSNMSYTVWITPSYVPKKMNVKTRFALTPANLLGGSDTMPNFRINAAQNHTVVFTDFNSPEKIELPAEAKSSA